MRVIAKRGLKKFWERPGSADARGPLHSWYEETLKAKWRTPQDIKEQYASASICGNNLVVLVVGGNSDDLKKVFHRLEKIFQAEEGTAQADERDVLVTLVEAYENRYYNFGPADPVEAIKFRMEQEGLTPRDLEPFIGPSGRVSEVLNRKRPLSLRMVKRLHDGLKIPYESLLTEVS